MKSQFEEIPHRIFLDSSTLQTIQDYGAFLHENEIVPEADSIYRDANGIDKLEALRLIMRIAERAPFEFVKHLNTWK